MKRLFLSEASDELAAAVAYYDELGPGLGDRLLDAVETALVHIEQWPEASQAISANTRRCLLAPFPYGLIYAIEDDGLIVIAIAHLRRKPGYWRDRLPRNQS
jgi:hypothetical protein